MYMDSLNYYRQQISHALHELVDWGEKRKEAEQQMAKLRQLIIANANFLPEDERGIFVKQAEDSVPSGFTDNIRHLFRVHFPDALTPVMLRQELLDAGIDLSAQSNPLASIHSVIRRLLDAEEIERYGKIENGAYRWKEEHPLRAISRKPKSADQVRAALDGVKGAAQKK
jgi:hypothetical protein